MILLADGHCQKSTGAFYRDLREHELIKDTNNTIERYFNTQMFDRYMRINADHYTYHMTPRESSRAGLMYKIDNVNKIHRAMGLDFAAEIHYNAFNGQTSGFEVWYWHTSRLAERLSKSICQEMNNFLNLIRLKNRGVKPSNTLSFLSRTMCPAIIIECCFMDGDYDLIQDKNRYEMLKVAIAHSLHKILVGGII